MNRAAWPGALAMLAAAWLGPPGSPQEEAEEIFRRSGVRGGIAVHLGCGEGRLTAALEGGGRFTVHGLDPRPDRVREARERLRALGLYGPVSVDLLEGPVLPYADDLVNLVVDETSGAVPEEELLRVTAPGGGLCRRTAGGWSVAGKPRPPEIDEWSHFLHDAGNNAVARDRVVGPPRSLRWLAPPLWLRSHETPSGFQAAVTGGGRLFYFFDEGLVGITDPRLPERWSLVCRDAFNGRLLWKRPLEKWGWPQWASERFAGKEWTTITGGRTLLPDQNQRRLVADGDRLYATLSFDAPLSILDAATGETRFLVEPTAPVREIVAAEGLAVVFSGPSPAVGRREDPKEVRAGALSAVRGRTGEILWRVETGPIQALTLAVDGGRVFYRAGGRIAALDLQTGRPRWAAEPQDKTVRTLVAHGGFLVLRGARGIETREGATGELLWSREIPPSGGPEGLDLFVIDGVVWPGLLSVDGDLKVNPKSGHALAVGYDLRTGQERGRVLAKNLRSPEHHHRCYRNKATERFLISSLEGAEFLALKGEGHAQNNFVRGACKYGMMPANGLLYVPPDQCFCQPGAKLLGFAAVGPEPAAPVRTVPDERRLERGEAFGAAAEEAPAPGDWPTFRHDPARHGTTSAGVGPGPAPAWRVRPGGPLTAPVAAGGRVYVASRDAHAVHALDLETGRELWTFVAGGRIDSPPTIHRGLVLFGSADGRVYCLRARDGALVWRFLAAPADRRVACFDQVESAWPVHGSVLVQDGVAYAAAGRSTYLDGGIRLWGLDPATGRVLHRGRLEGPFPDPEKGRDVSFYLPGANSDVLVAEGGSLYMRQKRLTPTLQEVPPKVLSSKGEADVGLHVFSTAGLLDGSWYNRTFWMYSKRWPGFQLANQAPKSGQLLVVDESTTYAVKVFYRRNVHSPMFFPGREGYLLFADRNSTEPQIVGEEGARPPLAWLPQSDFLRKEGLRKLDSPAFGLDKMIGYTRADPPLWTRWLPVRVRGLVKAGDVLFAAGVPDELDPKDPYAAFEGRKGARLVSVSARDGTVLAEREIGTPPVFDGLIAAGGRLLASLEDGSLLCLK